MSGTVNFFNPAVIAMGGDIAEAQAQLLAGVREGIFSRSLALTSRDLRIVPCRLGDRAGITGAAMMAIDEVLSPQAVDRTLPASAWRAVGRQLGADDGAAARWAVDLDRAVQSVRAVVEAEQSRAALALCATDAVVANVQTKRSTLDGYDNADARRLRVLDGVGESLRDDEVGVRLQG